MQLTIDVDKHFVESLQKEFHSNNIKDALYQLFDFYKQSSLFETIKHDEEDYALVLKAREKRKSGEKTYSIDSVINEY